MEDIEDNEFVASEHDRLINAISKLDKTQHITEPIRNEPTILHSEFSLSKRSNKLDLKNVVKILENTAHHVEIAKKLKKTQDVSKVLSKPLEKPQAERIKRATGYEETKKKVGRWDPVVARSRTVDFVSFPLKGAANKIEPKNEIMSKLTLKSPLEKELELLDPPKEVDEHSEEEQLYPMSYEEMVEHRQHLAKLRAQQSYKAAKAKRQSKIKSKKYHRVLKKEKLKQQLKEFEELQKNNPEEALKKLEGLEKARAVERHTLRHKNTGKWAKSLLGRAKYDKEARQQLAEQLSVSRNLTHKVKDNESTDDENEVNESISDITLSQDPVNPWMMKRPDKSNVDAEFDFGYKKYIKGKMFKQNDDSDTESNQYEENINENKCNSKHNEFGILKTVVKNLRQSDNDISISNTSKQKACKIVAKNKKCKNQLVATSNWSVETVNDTESYEKQANQTEQVLTAFDSLENDVARQVEKKLQKIRNNISKLEKRAKHSEQVSVKKEKETIDNLEYLKLKNKKVKPIIDEELIETQMNNIDEPQNEKKSISKIVNTVQTVQENVVSNIDPTRFIEVKPKYLNTALSAQVSEFDQLDDDDEQIVPKVNIEEVFEEDDVVASFRKEKADEIEKDKSEDIDISLPGWGCWGGKGVRTAKRKNNRFIVKAPPKVPRRDENKGDIIIKEFKNPKLAAHKVSDLPFPFTSIKEYEASIRTPLGNTFIPEKAHKRLIRPNVITKAGAIIEPMNEEELLIPKNRQCLLKIK